MLKMMCMSSVAHKSDMSRKLLLKIGKIGLSGFVDSDSSQGHHRHSMREFLLRPSDVWTEDRQEPWQPKGLKQQILDLIYEKKKRYKTRVKTRIKVNCVCSIVGYFTRP
jgi:hypothetical protein